LAHADWKIAKLGLEKLAAAKHNDGIYTLVEACGLIPLHPICRCAWAPYISELQRNALITTLVLGMSRSLPKKVSS